MTKRIKLTEDIFYDSGDGEFLLELMLTKEQKQGMLEDQEKAKKWDNQKHLILSREEFDNHSKLIQENKQLEVLVESHRNTGVIIETERHNLWKKLEKIKEWANVNQAKSGWNEEDIVSKIKEILEEK